MKLSELKKGTRAIVESVNLEDDLKKRFSAMGLSPGIILRVCRRTFGSDSLHVKVECSSCLALSKTEASQIKVTPIGKGMCLGNRGKSEQSEHFCDSEDCQMKADD
ncbi:MAG: ferrous iron transport protein A [Epsilonproteobacteria bacterium]|nr:ferrous iron transport protein A [Campylobacterota bacterium]